MSAGLWIAKGWLDELDENVPEDIIDAVAHFIPRLAKLLHDKGGVDAMGQLLERSEHWPDLIETMMGEQIRMTTREARRERSARV